MCAVAGWWPSETGEGVQLSKPANTETLDSGAQGSQIRAQDQIRNNSRLRRLCTSALDSDAQAGVNQAISLSSSCALSTLFNSFAGSSLHADLS